MKRLLIVVLVFTTLPIFAQKDQNFGPVFIIGEKIVSQKKVEKYANQGYIKAMNNGVSEEKFLALKKKHGDKIMAKEFVVLIEIYSKKELEALTRVDNATISDSSPKVREDKVLLQVGDDAPDFTVSMIDGQTISLSDLRGKVVLLNFWATWCAPCIREFYEIPPKILHKFKDKDFVFLPIARGEEALKVSKKLYTLKEDGIDFNSGVDPDRTIWDKYAIAGIPKNFIIDKEGKIAFALTGNNGDSVDAIRKEIKKLLRK